MGLHPAIPFVTDLIPANILVRGAPPWRAVQHEELNNKTPLIAVNI